MKPIYRILSITLILFFAFGSSIFAQPLEVQDATTPPWTPEALIKNVFLGDGIEVVDVQFEGNPQQVGFFNHGEDEMGINRGIIMSSGRAATQGASFGADATGVDFASTGVGGGTTDPDLQTIANGTLNDAVKFTITFRPAADTLRFNYVFASEEYPEWSCSQFNDVFGFFISGPGINGPFQSNGENIAIIPGTNQPVSINNIHPDDGPSCPPQFINFYNDNNGTMLQPVYDGYLDVFTAQAIVTPCEEYTIKLMITDVGDDIFDSGVFLEAKSFGTGTLEVEAATVSLDGTLAEGCGDGLLTFSLEFPPENDFVIDYNIIGTAENGVDYATIPNDLIITGGQTQVSVPIIAFDDGITEGQESIGIDVQRDVCTRDTIWIFIRENELLAPTLPPDTMMCVADTIGLDGEVPIMLPGPPTFTNDQDLVLADYSGNNAGVTSSTILVNGVQPAILGPNVIQSVCINIAHKWLDDLDIFLVAPGGQFIELTSDNGANCDDYISTCFTPDAVFPITFWAGNTCGPGENPPFTGTFQPEGVWSDLWDGENPTNGEWELLIIDDSQGFNGTLLDWTITFEPVYKVFYNWEPNYNISCTDCPNPNIFPDTATTYTVTATDTYGCEVTDSITVGFLSQLPSPDVTCAQITNNNITFEWTSVPGANGYQVNINGTGWVNVNDSLFHVINNLTPNDTVTIQVAALLDCPGEFGEMTCWTPDCDAPTGAIDDISHLECTPGSTGSVTVSATGGSGMGYSFSLGGETNTTGIFTDLAAGNHSITIEDSFGCANTVQALITQPNTFDLTEVIVNQISCEEGMDGAVTVTINGGTAPYTFNWNNSSADSVLTNLQAGIQNLTVTDASGCSASTMIELIDPDPIEIAIGSVPATCFGFNDGSAIVTPSGGEAPYTYIWDAAANNQTDSIATMLTSGSYFATVTDNKGCQSVALVAVGQPTELITGISGTDVDCYDAQNGTASVSAMNGTPGYLYEWNTTDTDADIDNLTGGLYSVTVTDANGCTSEESIQLSEPDSIGINFNFTDVDCFGNMTGELICVVFGGTVAGDYTYAWNTGDTDSDLNNIPAGDYCVTVTDDNGCTKVACQTISEPNELILTTTFNNAGCNGGSDGAIDLTIQGGTSPFGILWNNMEITEDLNNLDAGTYSVTVTDANDCTAETSVDISEIEAITLDVETTDILCFGANTGVIELTTSGGSGDLDFNWTGPNSWTSGAEDNINLSAGDYSVIVTDDEGCTATLDVTLTEPASAVTGTIDPPITICHGATNGVLSAEGMGGIQPYSYEWSSGQVIPDISNLPANAYTVTITDMNGCEAILGSEVVSQDSISMQLSQTTALCFNGNDGTASIDFILYGLSPADPNDFAINWSGTPQDSTTVTGLIGGQTYSVIITDLLGCTATNEITIGNPPEIGSAVVSITDVTCFDGSDGNATVTGEGGTEPYSYFWSPNAGGQMTATALDLPAQIFTVTITDNNGCTTSTQLSLGQPDPIRVNFQNDDILCYEEPTGASVADATGGTGPYTYLWESGVAGNTDANLPPGFTMITVTDSKGCMIIDSTFIRQPEAPLSANFDVEDASCPGKRDGQIQVFPQGGTPAYTYSLDGENFKGSSTILALESGFYNVFIQDGNGCIAETGEIFIDEPDLIMVEIGPDTTISLGESVEFTPVLINASGSDVSWFWWANNNQAIISDSVSREPTMTVESQTTFYLTVTDSLGCQAEDLVTVFVRKDRMVEVPTGFTPNFDGVNDLLLVHGKSDIVNQINFFRVFDRWGEMVYQAENFDINDFNIGWDGKFQGEDMQAGVYIWSLQVEYVDGLTEDLKGHTTLIR